MSLRVDAALAFCHQNQVAFFLICPKASYVPSGVLVGIRTFAKRSPNSTRCSLVSATDYYSFLPLSLGSKQGPQVFVGRKCKARIRPWSIRSGQLLSGEWARFTPHRSACEQAVRRASPRRQAPVRPGHTTGAPASPSGLASPTCSVLAPPCFHVSFLNLQPSQVSRESRVVSHCHTFRQAQIDVCISIFRVSFLLHLQSGKEIE